GQPLPPKAMTQSPAQPAPWPARFPALPGGGAAPPQPPTPAAAAAQPQTQPSPQQLSAPANFFATLPSTPVRGSPHAAPTLPPAVNPSTSPQPPAPDSSAQPAMLTPPGTVK